MVGRVGRGGRRIHVGGKYESAWGGGAGVGEGSTGGWTSGSGTTAGGLTTGITAVGSIIGGGSPVALVGSTTLDRSPPTGSPSTPLSATLATLLLATPSAPLATPSAIPPLSPGASNTNNGAPSLPSPGGGGGGGNSIDRLSGEGLSVTLLANPGLSFAGGVGA